ncbi:MAG: hypothetical protein M1837_005374 [Sclerophora amabilis]|nr:MAG: hypothetical protein M1837_005374 [Sclerophora amabilis]
MDIIKSAFSLLPKAVNLVLPFTRPGTPLLQDVLHTLVLCTILWYAPRVLERELESRHRREEEEVVVAPPRTPGIDHDESTAQHPPHDAHIPGRGRQAVDIDEDDPAPQGAAAAPNGAVPILGPENIDHPPPLLDAPAAHDDADLPDPAGAAEDPPTAASARAQNIGKKKAASLARKDQRRAYHEFVRSQGDAQRARDREEADAREAEMSAERARRAKLEEDVERRTREARERKRDEERKSREGEIARRKRAVEMIRSGLREDGVVDLRALARDVGGAGVDEGWLVGLGRAERIFGGGWKKEEGEGKGKEIVMSTGNGFGVRISERQLMEVRRQLSVADTDDDKEGFVSWREVGRVLEEVVRAPVTIGYGDAQKGHPQKDKRKLDAGMQRLEEDLPAEAFLNCLPDS